MSSSPPRVLTKTEIVRSFVDLRQQRKFLEEELSDVKRREKEAEDRLFDAMESDDEKTINHALGRVTRYIQHRATVTDAEVLFDALRERGLYDTHTKRVIRQAEMNALVKDIEKGEEEPIAGADLLLVRSIRFTPHK